MARTNLGKVYVVQGANGPEEARRPPDKVLELLNEARYLERTAMGISLSKEGFTLDHQVDIDGWDYWKAMAQRREYGYTWFPAASMPNVPIKPGLWMPDGGGGDGIVYDPNNPPLGAILVPASEEKDRNYVQPSPDPEPPPVLVEFGTQITEGFFTGGYRVGAKDTADLYSIQTGPDGAKYMKTYAFMTGWVYVKV